MESEHSLPEPARAEIVIAPVPAPRADGRGEAATGTTDARNLAVELRLHQDWRRTSRGPAADLSGVDLGGEDLRGVDFTGANLTGATFTDARLADARFAWARLAHADFTGASGVLGDQFARADLRGARFPASVRFAAPETASEVAEGTSKLFLTVLLICAYSWLTINSTVDQKLLTDTAVSKLPILNAEIPIVNFYALVPVALVGLAVVAMLQAQRLWAAVAAAPQVLPDGTTMADRASAWLLGPWAVERLVSADERGPLIRLQAWLAMAVGWWLVPATVVWFWERYLHRHDWSVTGLHVAALSIGCTAAAGFLALASWTLPRGTPGSVGGSGSRRPRWRRYLPVGVVACAVPLTFGTVSYAAIRGVHRGGDDDALSIQAVEVQPALSLEAAVPALQAGLPRLMSRVGMRPVAQLAETEVSTRLGPSALSDTGEEAKASGARLVGADLRFAAGERAFLALSDLRRADLLGADLWSADLRGANLTAASLVGSLLFNGDLRRVRANAAAVADRTDTASAIAYADTLLCSRTLFSAGNLRYARFARADLRGASFDDALLQGTSFAKARLQHATFVGADLDGADFRGSYGLTVGQVLSARHVGGLFDAPLLAQLKAGRQDRFATYDSVAIAAETERERLSGEDEPDTLTDAARKDRDRLIRAAYDAGVPASPTSAAIAGWVARGRKAPGSLDAVPPGCTVARGTAVVVGQRSRGY